jgi:carboxylesterase
VDTPDVLAVPDCGVRKRSPGGLMKKPYGVLIIHGFASSLDSVSDLAPPLESLGIPTLMPVLRGHGAESPEALRGVTWHDWVADAESALQAFSTEAERVIVVGHSMGALVALSLAADHADIIDSIVLVGAAVRLADPLAPGRPLRFLWPVVRRLFKKWSLPPVYADKTLAQYDTNYHWAPMDSILSFLEFTEVMRRRLPEVRVPTLVLHSHKDTTAAPESADVVYSGISTPAQQKRIVWFEVTDHEMLRDCERDAVIEAIEGYVRVRVGLEE